MLINKNIHPIINNKTLFKGQQFYFCLVETSSNTLIKVNLSKIYVRTEIKESNFFGEYRKFICQNNTFIIYEYLLKINDKSSLEIMKNGHHAILTNNKQDILNYIKKKFYNTIHNPWGHSIYTTKTQIVYNNALEQLKKL